MRGFSWCNGDYANRGLRHPWQARFRTTSGAYAALLYADAMDKYSGTPIEAHEAWKIFDQWKNRGQDIGVIFWGRSANLYTLGTVASLKNGRLELNGDSARVSFNLTGASFKYGPMQTWPHWPSPPIVEVNALRAEFSNGDYLTLAEGLTRDSTSSPVLPK